MRLFDWWLHAPEKLPTWLWGVLVPWILIGLLVAAVPELQVMPDAVQYCIGAPAALVIMWMIIGLIFRLVDGISMIGERLRNLARRAR